MPQHLPREMRRLSREMWMQVWGSASLKEMIHLLWETNTSPERDAASPVGDAVSPEGDLLASPNFGICDTTPFYLKLIPFLHYVT